MKGLIIYLADWMGTEEKTLSEVRHHLDLMCHPHSWWDWGLTLESDDHAQQFWGVKPIYRADSDEGIALVEECWSELEENKKRGLETYNDFTIFYATRALLSREILDLVMKEDNACVVPIILNT